MAEWIEPIYDRTPADVTRAKLQVKEWIEAIARGETVTITDLKGYLNVTDLNRIESNTEYLSLASHIDLTVKTNWDRQSCPNAVDVQRIIDNVTTLITELEFEEATYEMPTTMLTYSQVNTIEHNLSIIKYLFEDFPTRIQVEFAQFDLSADIELSLVLSMPVKVEFDQLDIKMSAKIIGSNGVAVKQEYDNIELIFNGKAANAISKPIVMRDSVEFEIESEVNDRLSNPIIFSLSSIESLSALIIDSDSTSMISNSITYPIEIQTTINVASSTDILETPKDSVIYTLIEATPYDLTTDTINSNILLPADLATATFSFADMFVTATFSLVENELYGELANVVSNSVESSIPSTIKTEAIVCLLVYAKLSNYTSIDLKTMDSKTLKDLSRIESFNTNSEE